MWLVAEPAGPATVATCGRKGSGVGGSMLRVQGGPLVVLLRSVPKPLPTPIQGLVPPRPRHATQGGCVRITRQPLLLLLQTMMCMLHSKCLRCQAQGCPRCRWSLLAAVLRWVAYLVGCRPSHLHNRWLPPHSKLVCTTTSLGERPVCTTTSL